MNGQGEDGSPVDLTDRANKALERAYEHAKRALDRDAEILDQMRTRASFLIAALAIGGTVLGVILSNSANGQLKSLPWLFALFALLWSALFLCVCLLWPARDTGTFGRHSHRYAYRSFRRRWRQWWNAVVRWREWWNAVVPGKKPGEMSGGTSSGTSDGKPVEKPSKSKAESSAFGRPGSISMT